MQIRNRNYIPTEDDIKCLLKNKQIGWRKDSELKFYVSFYLSQFTKAYGQKSMEYKYALRNKFKELPAEKIPLFKEALQEEFGDLNLVFLEPEEDIRNKKIYFLLQSEPLFSKLQLQALTMGEHFFSPNPFDFVDLCLRLMGLRDGLSQYKVTIFKTEQVLNMPRYKLRNIDLYLIKHEGAHALLDMSHPDAYGEDKNDNNPPFCPHLTSAETIMAYLKYSPAVQKEVTLLKKLPPSEQQAYAAEIEKRHAPIRLSNLDQLAKEAFIKDWMEELNKKSIFNSLSSLLNNALNQLWFQPAQRLVDNMNVWFDIIIDQAREYATQTAKECPHYFPPPCYPGKHFWQNSTHCFFSSTPLGQSASNQITYISNATCLPNKLG